MIEINKFLVVGGDLRNVELAKLLKEDGKIVYTYGMNVNSTENLETLLEDVEVVVGPILFSKDGLNVNSTFVESKILIKDFLKKIKGKILIAGNISEDVKKLAKIYNIEVIDVMKNEKLAILNTIATAEGTIELMIANTDTIIFESNVLILGFGRVAKTLADRLKGLVKSITCASRENDDLAWIEVYGYEKMNLNDLVKCQESKKYLKNYDVIINTIPSMILDAEKLQDVNKEVLLIDLASNPGGIDKEETKKQGLKLIHALGLPGKVAPKSSARFIKDIIYEVVTIYI